MNIKSLIGAGDRIMGTTLPFAALGIVLNLIYPEFFAMNLGWTGIGLGSVFLIAGIPIWFTSVVQVLIHVPRGELITTGPFAIVLHPLYTSVALLVIPGIGFVLDTWVGIAIGAVLYACSRLFAVKEERSLEEAFSTKYLEYRASVIFPWL